MIVVGGTVAFTLLFIMASYGIESKLGQPTRANRFLRLASEETGGQAD